MRLKFNSVWEPRSVRGLAGFFGLVFVIGTIGIGAALYLLTQRELARAEDARLDRELHRLLAPEGSASPSLAVIAQRIRTRQQQRSISVIGHRLVDRQGRLIAGMIEVDQALPGLSDVQFRESGTRWEPARALAADMPDGARLTIVAESESAEEMGKVIWPVFGTAVGLAILLGLLTSIALGRLIAARVAAIGATAAAIIAGNHAQRVPVDPLGGMFAEQARIFNRMLDRIEELLHNLRQVSSDLAHDLRTPITRLRAQLQEAADETIDPEQRAALLRAAERECENVLNIFTALLRISEVEAGRRQSHVAPLRLDLLVQDVVESYAPAFTDAERTLTLGSLDSDLISGDADLINQLLVNLTENALVHTPAGTRTSIAVRHCGTAVHLEIRDNGPGIPEGARAQVLDRFVRLDRSRGTPGNGLGLALVRAIARFHDANLDLHDARPGLLVRIAFPAAQPAAPALTTTTEGVITAV